MKSQWQTAFPKKTTEIVDRVSVRYMTSIWEKRLVLAVAMPILPNFRPTTYSCAQGVLPSTLLNRFYPRGFASMRVDVPLRTSKVTRESGRNCNALFTNCLLLCGHIQQVMELWKKLFFVPLVLMAGCGIVHVLR